jgi:DNA-binding MarR family transcriptional regulator
VRLTPAGRRQFRRMAATHERWIVELFAAWSDAEQGRVHDLLAALKSHLAAIDTLGAARGKPKQRKERAA